MAEIRPDGQYALWDGSDWNILNGPEGGEGPEGPDGPEGPIGPQGPPGNMSEIWQSGSAPLGGDGVRWVDPSIISPPPPGGHSHTEYIPKTDLPKLKADSALLNEAAWWVDAGSAKSDRLVDLTGRGRDAIFGAAAAAPTVLPWTGEDYIYVPETTGGGARLVVASTPTWVSTASVEVDLILHKLSVAQNYIFWSQSGLVPQINIQPGGLVRILSVSGQPLTTASVPLGVRTKIRVDLTATTATVYFNGVQQWTGASGPPTATTDSAVNLTASAASLAAGAPNVSIFSASGTIDGVNIFRFDPRNVSADYATIANTGSAGGNWTMFRPATGFKTAVVDRPLLLFGEAQWAALSSVLPTMPTATVLCAVRAFGAPGTIPAILDSRNTSGALYGLLLRRKTTQTYEVWAYVAGATGMDIGGVAGQSVIGLTVAGGTNTGYLNGVKAGTQATHVNWTGQHALPLTLGGRTNHTSDFFAGELLACAIWDRALTDAEIAEVSLDLAGVPHDKQPDPHPQYALESQVGNLLTENQAAGLGDFFTNTGSGWVPASGLTDPTGSIYKVSTITLPAPATTAGCFVYGGTGPSTSSGPTSGTIPVQPGQMYHFEFDAWVGAITSGSPTIDAQIQWFTSAGNVAASPASSTTGLLTATTTPNRWMIQGTAPDNAAFAACTIRKGTVGSIQTVYARRPGFWKGYAGAWSMPGTPITGLQSSMEQVALLADLPATGNWLGRRIQVTSGLGFQVMLWNGTAWKVSADSDTGKRLITSGVVNPAAGDCFLHRVGNMVTAQIAVSAFTPSTVVATIPTGWRIPLDGNAIIYAPKPYSINTNSVVWDGLGKVFMYGASVAEKSYLSYITDNAWPTTAP